MEEQKVKYIVEARKRGRHTVFDVYSETNQLLWKGLSLASMNDILGMMMD